MTPPWGDVRPSARSEISTNLLTGKAADRAGFSEDVLKPFAKQLVLQTVA